MSFPSRENGAKSHGPVYTFRKNAVSVWLPVRGGNSHNAFNTSARGEITPEKPVGVDSPIHVELSKVIQTKIRSVPFARRSGTGGKNVPGYKFTCPAVEPQVPRLLWHHLIFVVALFALQTAMLTVHPHLPDWWNVRDKKGMTPFDMALFLYASVCYGPKLSPTSLFSTAHTAIFLHRYSG
jgi:hypothetical protein